jgi:hypothetical protein
MNAYEPFSASKSCSQERLGTPSPIYSIRGKERMQNGRLRRTLNGRFGNSPELFKRSS